MSSDEYDSSDSRHYKVKLKKDKKDKDKKDKDKDKDKKDKDKDKKDKDKKDKDKKDKKDKKEGEYKSGEHKDKEGAHKFHGEHGAGLHGQQFQHQPPVQQNYGQFSSPPIVPPSFDPHHVAVPTFSTASYEAAPNRDAPAPPPSGYRVPLTTTAAFPDPQQAGQPPCYDADGVSPIFIGSALLGNSVHPCKIGPHLSPFASLPYGGVEHGHHGRFDLLPFVPQTMEFVHTSYGRIPPGRRPIEGGYEENGGKLYHAIGQVNGVRVPGKTGEHLGACNVGFGGQEIVITENYEILCWR